MPNLVKMEEETTQMRGHSRKIRKSQSVSNKGHKKIRTVFHIELWTPGMD